jgi:hypothetical protein
VNGIVKVRFAGTATATLNATERHHHFSSMRQLANADAIILVCPPLCLLVLGNPAPP